MQKRGIISELLEQQYQKQVESARTKNINKFIECFNLSSTSNKTRQIRILQIGNTGVTALTKKPFLTTQPIKKQSIGLFNNEMLGIQKDHKDNIFLDACKTGYFVDSSGQHKKNHSKTISPEKEPFFNVTQYVAISTSPKKSRGWLTRKKKMQQLPKQFYRRSSQNAAILDVGPIQVDENVSRSVNLLNKVKISQNYNFTALQNKSGAIIQHPAINASKPKSKIQQIRKTPQQQAQQQRRVKLEIKRQISQDYAKPFNPPINITAASYIIFEPKFSANYNGRRKKYYLEGENNIGGGSQGGPVSPDVNQRGKKKYPHSHKVIASLNSRNAVEVASLTKIMTCILAIEICQRFKLDPKQQKILIGKFESNIGGTSAQIGQGETYTLEDLFYGLMLPSGNDASVAIAVFCGRTLLHNESDIPPTHKKKQFYQRFVIEMNKKSKQLGMHKTTYANSHGLCNPQNKSCAFDLAILCQHAMENQKFKQIVSTKLYRNVIQYEVGIGNGGVSKKGSMKDIRDKGDDEIQEGEEIDLDSNQQQPEQKQTQSQKSQKQIQWQNTHRLVQQKSSQYIGIKTGITTAAGPCLSSCIRTSSGRCFIIIVLNCDKLSMRFKDTENLKKWVFQRQGMISPRKKVEKESGLSPREDPFTAFQ